MNDKYLALCGDIKVREKYHNRKPNWCRRHNRIITIEETICSVCFDDGRVFSSSSYLLYVPTLDSLWAWVEEIVKDKYYYNVLGFNKWLGTILEDNSEGYHYRAYTFDTIHEALLSYILSILDKEV